MIFSAIRWLCACKTAQAVTVSTLIPSSTRDMIRFFIKTPPKLLFTDSLDGILLVYTVFARKIWLYLSLSIVQATVAYSNES